MLEATSDHQYGFCIGGDGDCAAVREQYHAIAHTEAAVFDAIERARRKAAEERISIEQKVAEAEDALRAQQEAALALHSKVAAARRDGAASLAVNWPDAQTAAAALQRVDMELAEVRAGAVEADEADRKSLAVSKSLYQLYTSATGIRWDLASSQVEGHVALDLVRHFELGQVAAVDDGDTTIADALWNEIDSALPVNMRPAPRECRT